MKLGVIGICLIASAVFNAITAASVLYAIFQKSEVFVRGGYITAYSAGSVQLDQPVHVTVDNRIAGDVSIKQGVFERLQVEVH
jgi:hypothetical protein